MPIIEGSQARTLNKAGAPANGDFNGQAAPGALLVDTTAGDLYSNTGTLAATVWTLVGPAAT